jgi:hypothetical protein
MSDGAMLKNLPPEKLSYTAKNRKWRLDHVNWAENYIWSYDSVVRKSFSNKAINYNLICGMLDMRDLEVVLNPNDLKAKFIPDRIQHYPLINSKIQVLAGEESARRFDYTVVVTDYDSVSEVQEGRKNALMQDLAAWATAGVEDEEQARGELEKISKYNKYSWKDLREMRANVLMEHYWKEYNMPAMFNQGFYDAMVAGEEHYACEVVGGEPRVSRVNPNKMIVIKSGYSNKTEDADMIVLWDYWSPGKVIDTYYDVLTEKDVAYLSHLPFAQSTMEMENIDPMSTWAFVDGNDGISGEGIMLEGALAAGNVSFDRNFVDNFGNVRVVRVYWKSYRKLLKVKSYDMESGDEVYNFYPENYVVNEAMGEEATTLWVTEAWEGTKIGDKVYVNMRPKVVQYNRLSSPSRCHFGIVGRIYNLNERKPYSLVDMAKPYNYLYDVVHDRLNKNLAASWGKIGTLDLAKIPKDWDVEKWSYYAKKMHLNVMDSFKEGNRGAATGKLAGMMSGQTPTIDLDQGNIIQEDVQLLEFIKNEMSEVIGVTRQREGQISNRETVGGVERSVLQSSHTTEWLFMVHDDLKKAVCECFLETAKVALKGQSKKFPYLLDDATARVADFDGDAYAESDYGLVVENSDDNKSLRQNLTGLAQALVQAQTISTSTLVKMWTSGSTADMIRSLKEDEDTRQAAAEQAAQQQQEMQREQLAAEAEMQRAKMEQDERKSIRESETRVLVAQVQAEAAMAVAESKGLATNLFASETLEESVREFDERMAMERQKLEEKRKQNQEAMAMKREQAKNKQENKKSN